MRERRTNVRALPASTHDCAHLSPHGGHRDGWGAAFCTVDPPPRHASVVLAPPYVEDLTQSPLQPAASTGLDALLRMRHGGDGAASSDLPLLEGEGGGISHSGGDGTTTFHGPISSPSPGAAASVGPEGGMLWEGRGRDDEPSQGQQRHRPSLELNQEEMSFLSSAQFDLDDDEEDPYGPDSMPEPLPLRTTTTAAASPSTSARRDATARTTASTFAAARLNHHAAAAKRAPSPASTRSPPSAPPSSGSRTTERRASSSSAEYDFDDDIRATYDVRANELIAGALAEHGRQKTARAAVAAASASARVDVDREEEAVEERQGARASASARRSRKRRVTPEVAAAASDARGSEAESSSAADLDRKPAARRRSRPNGPPARSSQDAALDAKTNHKRSCPDDDDQEKESSTASTSCCICLDAPDRNDVASIDGCDHRFCFGCIEKWSSRENTCPLCKSRFHKIERVHRPPPTKRRRKGDPAPAANGSGGGGGSKVKFSKRVRNRDQRADLTSGNPLLHGLFASVEANGAMPQGIAHLIFSGMAGIHAGPFLVRDRRSSSSRVVPPSSRAAAGRASAAAAAAQRPPPAPWGVPPGLRGGAASAPSSAARRAASASSSVFPSVHLASLPRGGRGGVSDGLAAAAASAIAPLGTAASSDDDWMPPSPPTRPAVPPRPPSVQVRFGSPTATSLRNDAPFRRTTVLQDPHHQAPAGPWNPASTMTDSDEFDLDDDDDDDYFSDYDGGETFRSYIERVRSLERERTERAQVAQALDQYVHLQHRSPAAVGPASAPPPVAAAATASLPRGLSMRDIDPTPIRERPSALAAAAAASSLRPTVPYASTAAAASPAVGMGGAAGRAVSFPPAQAQPLRGPLAGESADTALEIDDDSDDDDDDVVEILAVGGSI